MGNENVEKPKVMLVDDEPHIMENLKMRLETDFEVITADGVEEAKGLLKNNSDVKVIISDQKMKGAEGSGLLKVVAETNPDVVRIMLTGFPEYDTAYKAIKDGKVFDYIIKEGGYLNNIKKTVLKAYEWYNTQREMRMLRDLAHQNVNNEVIQLEKNSVELGSQKKTILKLPPEKIWNLDRYYINMKYHANRVFNIYNKKGIEPKAGDIEYKCYYIGEVFIGEKLRELLSSYCANDEVDQVMAKDAISEMELVNVLKSNSLTGFQAEIVMSEAIGLRNITEELMFFTKKKWLLVQYQGNRIMYKIEERTTGDKIMVPKYMINDGKSVSCQKDADVLYGYDEDGKLLGKSEDFMDKLLEKLRK